MSDDAIIDTIAEKVARATWGEGRLWSGMGLVTEGRKDRNYQGRVSPGRGHPRRPA